MRTITFTNEKLLKLLSEKEVLVNEGRAVSEEIEKMEAELPLIDVEVMEAEKSVDITDLNEKANQATEDFNAVVKRMEDIRDEIYARMKKVIDPNLYKKYDDIKKSIADLEEKRNKIALKAQKYTDKIIPLTRKEMVKFLEDEFEDYESIKLENGIIVGTIFNHLEEFKTNFRNKK